MSSEVLCREVLCWEVLCWEVLCKGGLVSSEVLCWEVLCWEVLCKGGFVSSEVLCWEVLCKVGLVSPRSCDIGLMSCRSYVGRSYVTTSIFRPYFDRVGGSGPLVENSTF